MRWAVQGRRELLRGVEGEGGELGRTGRSRVDEAEGVGALIVPKLCPKPTARYGKIEQTGSWAKPVSR